MSKACGAVDVLFQPEKGTYRTPDDHSSGRKACPLGTPDDHPSGQKACPLGTPDEALAAMDAAGIAVALVSQCKRWSCERQWMCVDTGLEDVAGFVRFSPRFVGLAGYNPFAATESLREMEAARALGFRGVSVHAESFGLRLSDARFYPLWAKASEVSLPAVVQVPLAEPELARCLERMGRDFPELSLALVHPRPGRELFALCERFERLAFVLDTAALSWLCAHQGDLLDQAAMVERCLWGSNGAPLAEAVEKADGLGLPAESLAAILHGNALRYFAPAPDTQTAGAFSQEVIAAER